MRPRTSSPAMSVPGELITVKKVCNRPNVTIGQIVRERAA